MSRIGRQPVTIPSGVQVRVDGRQVTVKGSKGELSERMPAGVTLDQSDGTIELQRRDDSKAQRAYHGLARALVNNMVVGVTDGFKKTLEIHGVGYRADLKGREIHFALGYSHPVVFALPDGIDAAIEKNTTITLSGAHKQRVGQVAADIRKLRKPDVYKLKGIRYRGEQLKKKAGKTGA